MSRSLSIWFGQILCLVLYTLNPQIMERKLVALKEKREGSWRKCRDFNGLLDFSVSLCFPGVLVVSFAAYGASLFPHTFCFPMCVNLEINKKCLLWEWPLASQQWGWLSIWNECLKSLFKFHINEDCDHTKKDVVYKKVPLLLGSKFSCPLLAFNNSHS